MKMKNGDIIEYKGYTIIKKGRCYYKIKNKEIIGYSNCLKELKKGIDKNEKV